MSPAFSRKRDALTSRWRLGTFVRLGPSASDTLLFATPGPSCQLGPSFPSISPQPRLGTGKLGILLCYWFPLGPRSLGLRGKHVSVRSCLPPTRHPLRERRSGTGAHVQEKANLEARKPWAAAPTCPAEARLEAADEVPGPRACWGRPNTKQQQQARSRVLQWERRKQDTWVLSPALQRRALTAPCARGWTEAGRWGQWLIIRLPRRIATTKRFLGYLSTSDLLSQNLQGWCPGNLYISKLSGRFLRSVGTKNHWTP
ncbi:uncharacterized protein LOC123386248 [Felis catus]|uniref:uncharacterized protein LOC123386248 n=1 Tax=Felis catus TaxID=9685 RepID=UPI001D19EA88|nr:uncharacterized protein LOC123386248 [Felis catus]